MLYKGYVKVDKYKDPHEGSTSKCHLVMGEPKISQVEHLAKLDMEKKDRLKKVKLRNPQMESLAKFDMKENTDDAPSSDRHPEHTTNVSHSMFQSTHSAKEVLRMFKYKRKALQYKVKTSSDLDTHQDQDLAKFEGLHPREGITGHHALPVPPRAAKHAVRPALPLLNLIGAGKAIIVFTTQLFMFCYVSEFHI